MVQQVYIIADNILSPLGGDTQSNMDALFQGQSAIQRHERAISPEPFYAALFPEDGIKNIEGLSRFESLVVASVEKAITQSNIDAKGSDTIFILSSTKGNIAVLEENQNVGAEHISLPASAQKINNYFSNPNTPFVVCHACISGLVAINLAMRLLQAGKYKNAVVAGADLITRFVLSGFQSFHAVSDEPCTPFDANRKGVNLGEAAATLILSTQTRNTKNIILTGSAVTNDANHISGPSRTGDELALAIQRAKHEANISNETIKAINAHGTATRYNDDMESRAITTVGLQNKPVNSLKSYYGHTLGAAGLLETIVTAQSMRAGKFLPVKGLLQPGTIMPLRVTDELLNGNFDTCLKTASGFGGCNAAIILQLK